MTRPDGLFGRRASAAVQAALADTRVVVINGARQAGKSTLARLAIELRPDAVVRYLDDAGVRAAAQSDPGAFVRFPGLLVVDEVQRVPDLLPGRTETVELWSLSQGEIAGIPRPSPGRTPAGGPASSSPTSPI